MLHSEIWVAVIISVLLIMILGFILEFSPEQVLFSSGDIRELHNLWVYSEQIFASVSILFFNSPDSSLPTSCGALWRFYLCKASTILATQRCISPSLEWTF